VSSVGNRLHLRMRLYNSSRDVEPAAQKSNRNASDGRAGYKSSSQEEHLAHSRQRHAGSRDGATEHGDCVDAAIRSMDVEWPLVPEGLVRTRFVVSSDVLVMRAGGDSPEDKDVVEHSLPGVPDESAQQGFHVRARIAVRATRTPDDLSRQRSESELRVVVRRPDQPAVRSPCGVSGLLRAPLVGRRIGQCGMEDRSRRRSGKRVRTPRGTQSNVCTKSHPRHVVRTTVDQLCPSPRGRGRRMYRCIVRLHTRMPSLSRLATDALGTSAGCAPPSRDGARTRRSAVVPTAERRRPPERAESCAMPTENGRGLDEQVASRQAAATRAREQSVKRCQGVHRTRPATFRLATMSCCSEEARFATSSTRRRTRSAAVRKRIEEGRSAGRVYTARAMTICSRTGEVPAAQAGGDPIERLLHA